MCSGRNRRSVPRRAGTDTHGGRANQARIAEVGIEAAPNRVAADAARIAAPLLFHVQHDDEVFPHNGQRELFDLIGSPDKRLVTEPGPHAHTTPAAIAGWRAFLAEHLTGGDR